MLGNNAEANVVLMRKTLQAMVRDTPFNLSSVVVLLAMYWPLSNFIFLFVYNKLASLHCPLQGFVNEKWF